MADKYLKQDGSTFLFKPGKDGSLTDLRKRKPPTLDIMPRPSVAKIIPAKPIETMPFAPQTKHGYSNGGQHAVVGSSRG